jgi:hypothetical protein
MFLEICSLVKACVPKYYNISCSISFEQNNMAMLQPNVNSTNRDAGCVGLVHLKSRIIIVQSLAPQ